MARGGPFKRLGATGAGGDAERVAYTYASRIVVAQPLSTWNRHDAEGSRVAVA